MSYQAGIGDAGRPVSSMKGGAGYGFLGFWERNSWLAIGILWMAFFACGFVGFSRHLQASDRWEPTTWDVLYRTLQLLVLNFNPADQSKNLFVEAARFLGPPLATLTAIKALTTAFHERIRRLWLRFFIENHIVVCGLGRKGFLFVQGLLEHHRKVVVIDMGLNDELLRKCQRMRAIVLIGDARDDDLLKQARVYRARSLICVCGEDEVNAEIAERARKLAFSHRPKPLLCLVHVFSPHVCNLLRPVRDEVSRSPHFRLEWFCIFQNGAWAMLNEYSPFEARDNEPILCPHLLVVGLGWMGQSVVIQAARRWRARRTKTGERLRITAIDREAERISDYMIGRYEGLDKVCDLTPLTMDIESGDFQRARYLSGDTGACDVTSVYVCLDDPVRTMEASLTLAEKTWKLHADGRTAGRAIPILVRLDDDEGIASLLKVVQQHEESGMYHNIRAFPLFDETCAPDVLIGIEEPVKDPATGLQAFHRDVVTKRLHKPDTIERLARILHEDYLETQLSRGRSPGETASLVEWDELSEEFKESNREQARALSVDSLINHGFGLTPLTDWDPALLELTEQEKERLAKAEHHRWCREREGKGYRYGPERDDKKKTNPNIVAWEKLDKSVQDYNIEFIGKLPRLLADALDYEIYRLS